MFDGGFDGGFEGGRFVIPKRVKEAEPIAGQTDGEGIEAVDLFATTRNRAGPP
ncbi:MAG: hypothetical protein JKY00_14780 [Roseicyclus sp.]|nr:hypothetical protein [Roseicyclus sp.]